MYDEKKLEADLINEFESFHENPELAYEEYETTARIKNFLAERNIEILPLSLKTGLIAKIGAGDAKIALRADIDALPIEEQTALPYRSKTVGKMHACGHDFHTSSVLGAAHILKKREHELPCAVSIVFQPAEEAPGGAKTILATGALDGTDAILSLHSSPLFDVGVVGISAGAVTASVDKFAVTFTGRGTHAAHPERGIDPIVTAAQFVTAAQTIVARNIDPASPALVSVTQIKSGSTWNIMPETAWLEGTTRSLSAADRKLIKERLFALAENTAAAFGGTAAIDWYEGPPATDNDETLAAIARRTAEKNNLRILKAPVSLAGEDFAFYQEKMRGMFVIVGTGKSAANHNPKFEIDPRAILPTAKYLADLCLETMRR